MRLSVFSVVDEFPPGTGEGRDRFAEVVDLATVADRAGLHAFWVAEHHFHPGGLCPSPPVLLAAIGARTRHLRVGSLVSVLPFHNPIDVAEQYALLDRLVQGRLNLGVGSGYIPLEFEGFGVDPATKRDRFDRGLETVLAGFRGDPVRSDGVGTPEVRLNVRPVQSPHPPIWIAVQRREALPFVAARGASVALIPYATVSGVPELADEIKEFRAALPRGKEASVSVALHVYVGPRPSEATQALQRYLDGRLATQSTHYQAKVAADARHASARTIEESGFAVFGDATRVVERLWAFEEAGVDEILGIFDFGGLPYESARGSIEALGRAWPS